MSPPKRVLIVEDEPELAEVMRDYLAQAGMEAEILSEGTLAVETILDTAPDLVVLDVMLPGKDGLTICREVRAASDVPIIIETARVEEIDRLLGLELGADDYLCKPFSPRELVARIRAILRRTAPEGTVRRPEDSLRSTRPRCARRCWASRWT
ncbi:MAG: response regulator [Paracoccaceae bacterium]